MNLIKNITQQIREKYYPFLVTKLKDYERNHFRALKEARLSDDGGNYSLDGVSYDGENIYVAGRKSKVRVN